jgi:hypothetical protein
MYYVNIYEVSRRYGGPEEGGWWYDHCSPKSCHPVGRKIRKARVQYRKVLAIQKAVIALAARSAKRRKYGEIIGGNPADLDSREDFEPNDMRGVETQTEVRCYLETHQARHTPRPYYE